MVLPILINFAIVVAVLYFAARKPIGLQLESRSVSVEKSMHEAEAMARDSSQLLSRAESDWKSCEAHAQQLQKEAEVALEKFRTSTIDRANREAARLKSDAGRMAETEANRTKRRLNQELAHKSISLARQYLTDQIGDDDRHRLVADYVQTLEGANGR